MEDVALAGAATHRPDEARDARRRRATRPRAARRRRRAAPAMSRKEPPLTGGMSATSSPSASARSVDDVLAVDGVKKPAGSSPSSSRGQTSATLATSSSSRLERPASSRRPAKRRTVTRMRGSCLSVRGKRERPGCRPLATKEESQLAQGVTFVEQWFKGTYRGPIRKRRTVRSAAWPLPTTAAPNPASR